MTPRQARALAIIAVVVIALWATIPGRRGWFDVNVYHDAVVHWTRSPGHLYDFVIPGTHYGFTYPPFAALTMLPMGLLGSDTAIAANLMTTVVASAFLVYVMIDPIARREGWNRRYAFTVAACLFAFIEPVRDTVSYGQINIVLMALVYGDLILLTGRRTRYAGIGIGLATAIKLTPGLFIVYLLVARRWRAAAVATGTAVIATACAAAVAPTATSTYFTRVLWETNRIGEPSNVSNQSLMGLVARLRPDDAHHLVWIALTAAVTAVWLWRIRSVTAAGNDRFGFALTGVTACLISPITWVHHLVWLIPALVEVAASAQLAPPYDRRERWRLWTATAAYALLCSGIVFMWMHHHAGAIGLLGANLYVYITLLLLIATTAGDTSGPRRLGPPTMGSSEPSVQRSRIP